MLNKNLFTCAASFLILSAHARADDTVVVNATAPGATTQSEPASPDKQATLGSLGKRDIANTPYSIEVLPESLIKRQQLQSVTDLYRYLPSVQGDGARPQSRGMQGSVVQNSMIDGLNVVSTTDYPAEQFSSIEVLNGLAGSLYGPANPAGIFNFVSRRPTDTPQRSITVGGGTGTGPQISTDLSGPLDSGDRVKYRLNLLDDDGRGYASGSTRRRQLASLGLDFQLTDKLTMQTNFSYYHFYQKGLPGKFALAKGTSFPSALNPTNGRFGQYYAGDDDKTSTESVHFKYDFDGNWLGEFGFLHQVADRQSTAVTNTLTDNKGDYTSTVASATASRFTINSYMANLTGRVDTGWISHDLSMGMRGFVWKNFNPIGGATTTLGSANLDDPLQFKEPDYPDFTDRYHSATSTQQSFLLGDTLTFSPQWSLLLAGSESFLTANNYAKTGTRSSKSDNHGLSGSASLMYKPVENLTLYSTYADSLQQGDVAPSGSNNAGAILSPYRSKQVEVGGKLAVNDKLLLTADVFQIQRPYAYTLTNGDYGIAGKQRNRGLELLADGDLTSNLHVFGGITWLDPLLHDTGSDSTDGKQVVGLPRVTSDLLVVYDLPQVQGLSINAAGHYVGRRSTDNANSTWVGSYATFDLGTAYRTTLLGTATTFRLDVTNLTNRHYWTNIVPGGLNGYTGSGYASASLGDPRMAQLSMQVDF
ncbi:TonB-dependent siderophore receptor [Serratia sp. M24T3]|uniref:TonB-dependent receptor n=1 Tax=Serratia sp. M24T3 TaxID=932213 RepID=UPI00025B8F21|nr:TonB-dependent siderophore receptor [Serratia sp. M24T3]EIC84307.1 TonB-dependent siderophore receptor [Serratia sp. M24T3]